MLFVSMLTVLFINIPRCYSQQSQISVKKDYFVMPIFIDSNAFYKVIKSNDEIRQKYKDLKTKNEYENYYYGFKIAPSGNIVPMDSILDKSINDFIYKYFNSYKWVPAHDKYNPKYKLVSYGSLNFSLFPVKKIAIVTIIVGNGNVSYKTQVLYRKEIRMEK